MTDKLDFLRQKIDFIDDSIINLLAERLWIVKKIGEYKKQKGIAPLDQTRWEKVLLSKMAKAKTLGINPELVKKIYHFIHQEALKIEEKIKL